MTAQDCANWVRLLLASPSGSAVRWTDAQMLTIIDRAVKHLVAKIRFPESRLTQVATANQQEYALPELHVIRQVYLNGQIVVFADLETLEGSQIQYYDQSAQGTPVSGSGAAAGGGVAQPQWAVQTPLAYPFLNQYGFQTAPIAQTWLKGQRGRYYLRGGSIGFVPAPANGAVITIDCVRVPTTLTSMGQTVVVPDNFLDGIGWKSAQYAYMADNSDRAADQRNYAMGMYNDELKTLRTWKRQFGLEDVGPFPNTYRSSYRFGAHLTGDTADVW